jgi:uncharacterized protein involved in exopolysaccharide biosynthesis
MTSRPAADRAPASAPPTNETPIKPRRGLLIVLSIVLALWIAAMVVMYFTTVYPQRHPSHAATTSAAR